jgi:hypothetical protein
LINFSNRLKNRKAFPRARAPWALDSGGFTELKDHGRWRITAAEYVAEVRRYAEAIGRLEWAAPLDWMCEPWVIFGKNWHLPRGHRHRFEGTRHARGLQSGDPEQDLATASSPLLTLGLRLGEGWLTGVACACKDGDREGWLGNFLSLSRVKTLVRAVDQVVFLSGLGCLLVLVDEAAG